MQSEEHLAKAYLTPARTARQPLGEVNLQSSLDTPQLPEAKVSTSKTFRAPQSAFKRAVGPAEVCGGLGLG